MKTGIADLPLHHGKCPFWLFRRMKGLAKRIAKIIVTEYGEKELMKRLSDPYFFQALGCTIGFDWHSSGLTTTVCGALKEAVNEENLSIKIAGGKGKVSLRVPEEIRVLSEDLNLTTKQIERIIYVSKMAAKVDNAVLQDGYNLYHHIILFDGRGNWCVIQQGMNVVSHYARRYHWFSENVESFTEEPHTAIVADKKEQFVLNLVSKRSKEVRKTSVDLVKDGINHLKSDFVLLKKTPQRSILHFVKDFNPKIVPEYLKMPKTLNWKALEKVYEFKPKNYEELISIKGVGPSTIRGLAYISTLIYGSKIDWKDPVKFSFAYGGKDGVPKPVDRKAMDESIRFLDEILSKSKLEELRKLRKFIRLPESKNL